MAIKVRHYKVDDLAIREDPGNEVVADQTIRLVVNEQAVKIDLSSANAAKFYDVIRPYMEAGERIKSPSRPRPKAQRQQAATIREWARSANIKVNENGRIPRDVIARYQDAMAT